MYDKGVEDMVLLNHFHTSSVAVEWGVWEPGKENVAHPKVHIVDWRPCSEYLLHAMDEYVVQQDTPEGRATYASQFSQFGVVAIAADQDKNECKVTIHRVDDNPIFQNNRVKTGPIRNSKE